MLNMLGAVAEFERAIINERRLEGIAKAKEKGVVSEETINIGRYSEINQLLDDGLSIRAVATQLQCGVSTVQRAKAYKIAYKIKKPHPRREARQSKHNFNYRQCCSSKRWNQEQNHPQTALG
ncbi:recombinase family protein [Vibrio parahaemolyticus]|nr:recombinase family protein [Vibrio parahaemolyticus]MDN4712583.1 recombinase family protein [Vibrio parahaemolyticus]